MKFGQYELLEPIAIGGMAEVFKGRVAGAEGFEKFVAIKRILPSLAEDERIVKMLLTEARIHSALSHRNIVQIHDLGISEHGEYFIVLEYVEGYDLRVMSEQLAAEHDIVPEALSLYIASEVAEGLHFAHELRGADGQPLGLVHRDVTPSNILISFSGEVKLSDFGLAKRRRDHSVVGSLKGSLTYMSPEQALQGELDRRTDIFSLGAVLFELVTGRRFRDISDEVAGWTQVASGVLPSARALRPDIPTSVARLLDRALAPDPARRFADAASFGAAMRDALAQMNIPVGASDLAALAASISPPKRPRALMLERSKVIRLGPEAEALREMIASPVAMLSTPAGEPDLDTTPVPTARVGRPPGQDPMATPPPDEVTPARGTAPSSPPARTDQTGTAGGLVRSAGTALHDEAQLRQRASVAPEPTTGVWVAAGSAATTHAGAVPRRAPAASSGKQVAPPSRLTGPADAWATGANLGYSPPLPDVYPPTVRLRSRRRWRTPVLAVLALTAGAAAGTHFFFVPLDVLARWTQPARASFATTPPGASLRLDGATLASASPTFISVRRDRAEHVLEAAHPGYLPARQVIRFDRAVVLSFRVDLEKEPAQVGPRQAP